MIKVYTGLKGLAVTLFFIAGVVLFISIFFWGMAKVIQFFLPLLIVASYLLIFIFLVVILPATFFKQLRPSLALYSTLMSHVLGFSAWMMFFATVGAMLKGSWVYAGHLLLWISFTYGMRFYSQWLLNLNPRKQEKSNIIDVDAIEVRGH